MKKISNVARFFLLLLLLGAAGSMQTLNAQGRQKGISLDLGEPEDSTLSVLGYDYIERVEQVVFDHALLSSRVGTSTAEELIRIPSVPPEYCTDRRLHAAEIYATLDLGDDYEYGTTSFATDLTFTITAVDGVGATLFTHAAIPLDIDQHAPEQLFRVRLEGADLTTFDQVAKLKITIDSYTSNATVKSDLRLTVGFREQHAVDARDMGAPADPRIRVDSLTGLRTDNPVTFRWNISGSCNDTFPNYQFQLLRLKNFDTSATYRNYEDHVRARIDWRHALTLETGSGRRELTLTLAEGTGYYVWRVRPIGSYCEGGIANDSNWGAWSLSPPTDTVVNFTSYSTIPTWAFYYDQFDDDLNWVYDRTFTEGLRIAEGMSYVTPLIESRQQQVRIRSADSLVVSQSVSDYSGRQVIASLPAPVDEGAFRYIPEFLTNDGKLYSAANFDAAGNYDNPDQIDGGPVADFYSDTNPDLEIPGAGGYPFVQTRIGRDGSGRVEKQAAAGSVHRLGSTASGKERALKVMYGGVSDRELIRMFGDEAPSDTSVSKIITIDPNKVASVQYVSMDGRLLATAVMRRQGDTLLTALQEDSLSETVSDTLSGERRGGKYDYATTKRLAFADTTQVVLKYQMVGDTIKESGCVEACATCDYLIRLHVRNVENPDSSRSYDFHITGSHLVCTEFPEQDTTLTLTLPPGTYVFQREVITGNVDPATQTSDTPFGLSYAERYKERIAGLVRDAIEGDDSLSTILGFLDEKDIDGLYAYLDVDPKTTTSVTIGTSCCDVTIPIIDPDCGLNPCAAGTPNFEAHLISKWKETFDAGSATGEDDMNKYFGLGSTDKYPASNVTYPKGRGAFNAMIANMLAETSSGQPVYDCKKLWQCWDAIIETFGDMKKSGPGSTVNDGYDLLEHFLDCAGKRLIGTSTTPYHASAGYLSHAYKYFNYTVNPSGACELGLGYNSGWVGNVDSAGRWADLQRCVVGQSIRGQMAASGFKICWDSTTSNASERDTCIMDQAAIMEGECRSVCARRYDEFVHAVLTAYGRPVGQDTLSCIVEKLIDSCQNNCDITLVVDGSGHITQFGAPEDWVRMSRVFSQDLVVSVPSGGTCPDTSVLAPGDQRPYHDQVIEQLNEALDVYSRDSVGVDGGYWNFKNKLRLIAPNLVGRISDSLIYVRHGDGNARFERINGCELWYTADTVVLGTAQDPHPLVRQLNDYVNALWGYAVPVEVGAEWRCFSDDGEYFLTYDQPVDYLDAVPASYFDSVSYGGINGNVEPRVPSQYVYGTFPHLIGDSHHAYVGFGKPSDEVKRLIHVPIILLGTNGDWIYQTGGGGSGGSGDSCLSLAGFGKAIIRASIADTLLLFVGTDTSGSLVCSDPHGRCHETSLYEMYQLAAKPYTDVVGYFSQDSDGYLTYSNYEFGKNPSPTPQRMFGIRFFSQLHKQIASNICDTIGCPSICFKWVPRDTTVTGVDTMTIVDCKETAVRRIRSAIDREVGLCVEEHVKGAEEHYLSVCANPDRLEDELILDYPVREYHFTLYYYDRAGNLIKTVPPHGVNLSATTRATHPGHTFVTKYDYNSLAQGVWSWTPDADTTYTYYDSKGRLRFTRNQLQRNSGTYGYLKYDRLGRLVEIGQSSDSVSGGVFLGKADLQSFPGNGTERTYTVYTTPSSVVYLDGTPQRNLRDRISYTYTDDGVETHYSYDVHGNVEWVAQEIPGFPRTNYVKYQYDLIIGNVQEVNYNEGRMDQFHHRFTYDEDNRLTKVETSRDHEVWDRDAGYSYKIHGPLDRRELGEDKLQGLDYTYTLSSALKAINHPTLDAANDPGEDGTSNLYPADSFATALGYYGTDFVRSGSPLDESDPSMLKGVPLYDGNISSWMSHVGHKVGGRYEQLTGEIYRYDQLGRLDSSRFRYDSAGVYRKTEQYGSQYDYDGAGNITKLTRRGYDTLTKVDMDSMTYHYVSGRNRLDHFADAVTGEPYAGDLAGTGDYEYNAVGQMTRDVDEDIDVEWDIYGKPSGISTSVVGGEATTGYLYDATGNRVRKHSSTPGGGSPTTSTTYYVYDAGGNVVAIYEQVCNPGMVGLADADGDGVPDLSDNCIATWNPGQEDYNNDGQGDACDTDDDGDGALDGVDPCQWGVGPLCPPNDFDNDGIPNAFDPCPFHWNPSVSPTDTDSDGIPDYCDGDVDGDGVDNEHDNCPWGANPGQEDFDSDGVGDVCEPCQIKIAEFPIYGLEREGLALPDTNIYLPPADTIYTRELNRKRYELKDHLGNVRATLSDIKLPLTTPGSAPFEADIRSYMNPYPFGMPQPGRTWEGGLHRYGYNGKEQDKEWYGPGAMYDYGFRNYDPRLARFLSVDPLTAGYPWYTPYQYAGNMPIWAIDVNGLSVGAGDNEAQGGETETQADIDKKLETLNFLSPDVIVTAKRPRTFWGDVADFMKGVGVGILQGLGSTIETGLRFMTSNEAWEQLPSDLWTGAKKTAKFATLGYMLTHGDVNSRMAAQAELYGYWERVSTVWNGASWADRGKMTGFTLQKGAEALVVTKALGSFRALAELELPVVSGVSGAGLPAAASAGASRVLNFSQITASPWFSAEGSFAGQTISDVAAQLRYGKLTAAQVPVQVVTMDGATLIVNTRSSLALMQAGIPQSAWNLIDLTGDPGVMRYIAERLSKNGLTAAGTPVLRVTGAGRNASIYRGSGTVLPRQ